MATDDAGKQQERKLQRQPSNHAALYLSNLPFSIAPVQVEDAFHEHAKIDLAHVELLKKGNGTSAKTCGLGIVTLHDPDPQHLDAVLRIMDGKALMGRPMIVRKDRFVEDDYGYVPREDEKQPKPTAQAAH